MKTIIAMIRLALEQAGLSVHYVQAPNDATYPYVLLWSTPGQPGIEAGIAPDSDVSDLLGVTMVDTYPENVLLLAGKVRQALANLAVESDGTRVVVSLTVSQAVQPDRDVILPETSLHPFYAVDRYQVVATAA